jgi:hypothetical protein
MRVAGNLYDFARVGVTPGTPRPKVLPIGGQQASLLLSLLLPSSWAEQYVPELKATLAMALEPYRILQV